MHRLVREWVPASVHRARFEVCFKDRAQRMPFALTPGPSPGGRGETYEIPMDEIDTSSDSRRGLRFVLFAVLLCAYLISGVLPVAAIGNEDSGYIYGHHAFFYTFTGKKSDPERPQHWGLAANFAFLVGMAALFHGQYPGAAGAGTLATCLSIAVFGIGPDNFRPCWWVHFGPFSPVSMDHWKTLPHANGPFLIGFYVWSFTFVALIAIGVMGSIRFGQPAKVPTAGPYVKHVL